MASDPHRPEHLGTVVIGGGQAGLSVGYHLARRNVPFVIFEGRDRIGDAWRERWDSLRLFTPAGFSALDGMPFPSHPHDFPTKDEMADYLEAYAERFQLPVRTGTRVEHLDRKDGVFRLRAGERTFTADQVVVAMADYQEGWRPSFAGELDEDIVQIHSADYRGPDQLRPGPVLIVGAGNSGAEIARELATRHTVHMSGRGTGEIPFRIEGFLGRHLLVRLVLRVIFHRVLTMKTPMGRKARRKMGHHGGPLIRVKARDLKRMGVERVPRTAGVRDGLPLLDDGRVLDVANVVWCTGFRPGFEWIDLPIFEGREPRHRSGIVDDAPGLYFVGLFFLHALSSAMIQGVGRDAERVAKVIARRPRAASPRLAGSGALRGERGRTAAPAS